VRDRRVEGGLEVGLEALVQRLIVIFEKVYTPIVGKYMIAFLKW
jgi:hypothetical protein